MKKMQNQQGITMVEILVTILIIAVGLLGMASLQFNSLKNLNNSFFQYQAAMHASEMAERMRANIDGITGGNYDSVSVDGSETSASCTSACTASGLASHDIYEWGQAVSGLPDGAATISRTGNIFTITITWSEQNTGSTGSSTGGAVSKSHVLRVEF